MHIRNATMQDLEALTAVEAACFPAAEAATRADFAARLAVYPNHFWLLEDEGTLVSFVDGMVTDEPFLRDEMYDNASLHNEQGAWQMIFGVNTIPAYRRRGCVLTCKEELIHYYAAFGYRCEGVSGSTHGGVVWYDMRLTF